MKKEKREKVKKNKQSKKRKITQQCLPQRQKQQPHFYFKRLVFLFS